MYKLSKDWICSWCVIEVLQATHQGLSPMQKGDNTSKFYKFVDTFLSRNSLSSVRCWKQYISPPDTSSAVDQEAEEEFEPPLAFNKLGSSVCNKPLSSFMQVCKTFYNLLWITELKKDILAKCIFIIHNLLLQIHTDVSATDKIFNKDVGFFWQTVDSQESFYEHGAGHMSGENILQNTVVILHHEALFLPKVCHLCSGSAGFFSLNVPVKTIPTLWQNDFVIAFAKFFLEQNLLQAVDYKSQFKLSSLNWLTLKTLPRSQNGVNSRYDFKNFA